MFSGSCAFVTLSFNPLRSLSSAQDTNARLSIPRCFRGLIPAVPSLLYPSLHSMEKVSLGTARNHDRNSRLSSLGDSYYDTDTSLLGPGPFFPSPLSFLLVPISLYFLRYTRDRVLPPPPRHIRVF